jgi:hypothetical protein
MSGLLVAKVLVSLDLPDAVLRAGGGYGDPILSTGGTSILTENSAPVAEVTSPPWALGPRHKHQPAPSFVLGTQWET